MKDWDKTSNIIEKEESYDFRYVHTFEGTLEIDFLKKDQTVQKKISEYYIDRANLDKTQQAEIEKNLKIEDYSLSGRPGLVFLKVSVPKVYVPREKKVYVPREKEDSHPTNFKFTDALIEKILGSKDILDYEGYVFSREEYKEDFKQELYSRSKYETENVSDPNLKTLLNETFSDTSSDSIYEQILNKFPVEELAGLVMNCLTKLMSLQEMKKVICSKVLREIDRPGLERIAEFLELAGDEISSQISKEIRTLDLDNDKEALYAYTLSGINPETREDKICFAVFAAIPAALYLLTKLINGDKELKDKIKDDIEVVKKAITKKAITKRAELFVLPDEETVTDMMRSITEVIQEAAESFILNTIIFVVLNTINTLQEACDSQEQDNSRTNRNPIGKLNISDLLEKTAKERQTKHDLDRFKDFLDELSKKLSLTEICLLLNGNFKDPILTIVLQILSQDKYSNLREEINETNIKSFFEVLSRFVDKKYCEEALEEWEKQKKTIIEICTDTTKLKEDLYKSIYGNTVSLEDILRQVELETAKNKSRIENIVDLLNPKQFVEPKKKFHDTQKYLLETIAGKNLEAVSKQMNADLPAYKKLLLENKDFTNTLTTALQNTGSASEQTKIVAQDLQTEIQSKKQVGKIISKTNSFQVQFENGNLLVGSNTSFLTLGNETIKRDDGQNSYEDVLKKTKSQTRIKVLDESPTRYYGETLKKVLEILLDVSMSQNNLLQVQNFMKYPLVSWEKPIEGPCHGNFFSLQKIFNGTEEFDNISNNFISNSPTPEQDFIVYLCFRIYLISICLQTCLTGLFAINLFPASSFSEKTVLHKIMEKTVLKEIDQKVIGDLEKILILKTGSEDNKQNLSNEIKEVLSIVSIEILKRNGDTNLFSASPTSILCNIAENFKNDDIKFEKYIRIEKSPNFENYLPKNSERIYKTFKLFIYQQLMTNNETFGFDMLLFPGLRLENKDIFKLPFFDVISSYSFDSEPNLDFVKSSKMDLSYRGVIFEENLTALNEARSQYQKIHTGSVLFKDFREKFVNFNMSVNKNTTAESSTEVSDFFEWILGTKVLHFFEIHYGERVSIVHQADPGDLDISELLNKVGKQTNGYNKIVLLEKEQADVPELYGTKIVDYLKNELTIESVDLKNSEDNSETESLLKIDLLQDIVFSIIFERMNFVYGDEISKIFQNAKGLAVKIIYSTSGKNWEQDYRQNEKTFSGGLPEFSVFRVVLSSFLKSAANMTDPTWKVFPLTPIGWAARYVDSEENGTESGRPAKKDVCKD